MFPNAGDTDSYVLWASLTWLYTCRNANYVLHTNLHHVKTITLDEWRTYKYQIGEDWKVWVSLEWEPLVPKMPSNGDKLIFTHTYNVVHICVYETILPSCLGRNPSSRVLWMKGFMALFPFGKDDVAFTNELEG